MSAETNPAESKPAESKPAENKPNEPKPGEPKPTETKSTASHAETPPPSRRPPRSIPWWTLVLLAIVGVGGLWIGTRWGGRIEAGLHTIAAKIRPETAHSAPGDSDEAPEPIQYYTCGMHPWVILPHPGDCPICHMKLTPLDPAKFSGEVSIDPVVVQNIGVRIEPVTEGPLVRTIRTVGSVDYDETRVRDVNTKLSGWIEKLHVDYVGASVSEGDPLFEVYSPALLAAEEEYLLALRAQAPGGTPLPGALDLAESARTKLSLFDITPAQIDALAATGKASRTMTLLSPHTGVVIAKHANEGMKIDPGMQVFQIADLSKVWVLVTLYESQLPFVSLGQSATMSLPYIPGQTSEGRVVYIYPYVNTKTREVQVRLEFDNADGLLKPGMFATIELRSTLRQHAVLVPREAVISTGKRDIAFVSLGEGRFDPRELRLGVETGDGQVEILDGLAPGELVVTSGQFLLDSESRVREALAKMIRGDMASDQTTQAASAGSTELKGMPQAMATGLAAALDAYFLLGEQLASDSASGLDEPARALAAALDGVIGIEMPGDEHFWHRHTEVATARGGALELVGETDLDAAREHFADLSVALDTLLRSTGIPPGYASAVQSLHCPMFRDGQGGSTWLQPEGAVRNPFFGSAMLRCFDRRETIPVTGATETSPTDRPTDESTPEPAAADTQRAVDETIAAYLEAQEHLAKDQFEDASGELIRLREVATPLSRSPDGLGEAARGLVGSLAVVPADAAGQREAFANVSDALLALLAAAPPSAGDLLHFHCPMVGEDWIQIGETARNPYDPEMPTCGKIVGPVAPRKSAESTR